MFADVVFVVVPALEPPLPVVVSAPRPVWPPPVLVDVSLLDPPPLPVSELELDPPVDELEEVPELLFLLVVVVLATGGVALPVVGTVSGGAPVVSFGPTPLPPHAARASATMTAQTASRASVRRLRR